MASGRNVIENPSNEEHERMQEPSDAQQEDNSHDIQGSVLVIGGGIAGAQASLDLADSGFRVYLVESEPSIGGHMAQLDKTFPTNDCSMCILSPKLVAVASHPNIKIMTLAEVTELSGSPGNFTAKVLRKARFVDESKCTGCNDCSKICPVRVPSEFDLGLKQRTAAYIPFPQAVPRAAVVERRGAAPCKSACPAGLSAMGYVNLIREGMFKEAYNLIMRTIPLPSSCGRICHHPCEDYCTRGKIDSPLAIAALKSFIGDYARENKLVPKLRTAPKRKEKVAVIGAGPAGLTAAFRLALRGFTVRIFEKTSKPGGMLWWGIPDFRLSKDILESEIETLLRSGIEIEYNKTIGKDLTLEELRKEYQAIFLAIGSHRRLKIGIEGEDLKGVIHGIDFLKMIVSGENVEIGRNVAIVGGGITAIDAARTALRMGAKVTVLYRRGLEDMVAMPYEVQAAKEEGVEFQFYVGPVRIIGKDGKVEGIECIRMKPGEKDETGRPIPIPIEGSEFVLPFDMIIPAVSQAPEADVLGEDIELTDWKTIKVDQKSMLTNLPGVFAGGDAVSGPASAVEAFAAGNKAARCIERYLNGQDPAEEKEEEDKFYHVTLEEIMARMGGEIPRKERVARKRLSVEERVKKFAEVELGYTESSAKEEAFRCVHCRPCALCDQCIEVCQANAIDYSMKNETVELKVGSVVLAPGMDSYNPKNLRQFGFGRYKNVLTNLQFERMMNSSGPFGGHIQRLTDKKEPIEIAFAQCIGSRDEKAGKPYCSTICCMAAIKAAIIAKEHNPNIRPTIFYIDIRAVGKEFEDYYLRAKKLGIKFIRSKLAGISELKDGSLEVRYDTDRGVASKEFDMVVLSVGFDLPSSAKKLAKALNVQLDEHGFIEGNRYNPMKTSNPGVFACGIITGTKDIPDTVAQASGAAAQAAAVVASKRGALVVEKAYPMERDVSLERPRIGVFVCHCGTNIGGVVDVPSVVEYAKTLPYVEYATENTYTCSQDTQKKIVDIIREKNLNRIVVAACSPRTHEPLFRNTIREAGLNQYLFEMANIRDQCSWVHMNERMAATEKAKDLVRMSVSRAKLLDQLPKQTFPVTKRALIIGGGVTGLTAAIGLSEQGYPSILVEKEERLGGRFSKVRYSMDGGSPKEYLDALIARAESDPNIQILTGSTVTDVKGFVGNFESRIELPSGNELTVTHGVVIVATGSDELVPSQYRYGTDRRVIRQSELEELIAEGRLEAKRLVMLQCVGARCKERSYCSRICCSEAVKNAIALKRKWPDCEVTVLHKDIRTYGLHELRYREAQELGVRFVRFDEEREPVLEDSVGMLRIRVNDADLEDEELELDADMLVLSVPMIPNPTNQEIAKILKVPLSKDGFFLEAHMKLRPVDFATDGIFIAGSAQWPKFADECIAQAYATVSRACTVLSKSSIEGEGIVPAVDAYRCTGCGLCAAVCVTNAIDVSTGVAVVNEALCKGCGSCVGTCPSGAIQQKHLRDDQIIEMIKSAVSE
ncbi:MAG: FAD-dependent oxidoreductase [Thermoplasmata archaeon]